MNLKLHLLSEAEACVSQSQPNMDTTKFNTNTVKPQYNSSPCDLKRNKTCLPELFSGYAKKNNGQSYKKSTAIKSVYIT